MDAAKASSSLVRRLGVSGVAAAALVAFLVVTGVAERETGDVKLR